jgi:zinc transporter 1/2/3
LVEPISNLAEDERTRPRCPEEGLGSEKEEKPAIGRRRQVIGLLVLQLGIMIHSIVIGLTLAITTGADFSEFDLLDYLTFANWSVSASLTTAVVFHQLFEGLSLGIRIAALPPPSHPTADVVPQLNTSEPTKSEAGDHRGFVNNMMRAIGGGRGEGWLKFSLGILFAITTPAGMGLGMMAFKVGEKKEGIELGKYEAFS